MDRTTAAHASHDELLIARLFGGDVDEPERDRALELMAECADCAALFADLDSIEGATVEMAVPVRPRDFTLTAEDAARLGRGRRTSGAGRLVGLRRAFGGAMAAVGLFGIVATSTFAWFGGTGGAGFTNTSAERGGSDSAYAAATNAPAVPGAVDISSAGPKATAPAIDPNGHTGDGVSSPIPVTAPTAGSSTAKDLAASSPAPNPQSSQNYVICCGQPSSGNTQSGGEGVSPSSPSTSGAVDARFIWLAGFGGLLMAGLVVLLLPRVRRRRS